MFASLNVLKELQKHYETNPKDPLKGIIWHTQGSGKTALTYHLTKLIKDFFSPLGKKTKFYFIVDRLDLLEQAKNEFLKRGLQAHEAENKEDLSQKLKSSSVFENPQGNDEIIVVNIQKFKAPNEDSSDSAHKEIISKTDLQESIQNSHDLQRVFIIDEAHRSYDPKGCFYANLIECDKTAIKIALTGTPLLEDNAQDKATKKTFGNYLHTYSYTESIKDAHTLTLQLETIEKSYKEKLQEIYRLLQESITIKDIEIKKETIFNDEKYIKAMLSYIIRDLLKFRQLNDNNEHLKAMVVCFSSKQARLANFLFNEVQEEVLQKNPNLMILNKLKSSLILHDEQEVKEKIYSFKHEDTDIAFVFNMLLTGFDLPNLKCLYIHRELKDHNLLQALARVNRPYNNMSFGYLIDFVGIQENFDKTTDDYLKELNRFNQSNANSDSNIKDIFADRETLEKDIKNAYNDLFDYPIDNIEGMTSAIVNMSEINELQKVSHAIKTLKERYNLIRASNDEKILSLKEKIDIEKINKISFMLSQKAKQLYALKKINEPKNPNDLIILEDLIALLDFKIAFKERKELHFKESEEISAKQKQAKEILEKIPDQKDKEIQKIYKEFSKLLQTPATSQNFDGISHSYSAIISQLKQHKEQTTHLLNKYDNDLSYAITHKRLHERFMEENISDPVGIFTLLSALKKAIDERISKNNHKINELLHTLAYKIYEYYFKYKPKNAKLEQIIIENPKSSIMVKNAQKTQDKYPFFTSGDNILSYPKAIIDGRNCFLNTGGNAGIKFYVGKASYSTDTWCICANEFSDYLYLLLSNIKTHINQSFFQGTSLKHLQKNLLKKYPIYMPSAHEIKKFNQIIMPLLTLISINTRTSKKLEQIRDFLLPLLLKQQVKPQ